VLAAVLKSVIGCLRLRRGASLSLSRSAISSMSAGGGAHAMALERMLQLAALAQQLMAAALLHLIALQVV